jgi:hypothetical protein
MFAALMTAEVMTVLRDRRFLDSRDVHVAIVQATPDGGVSVGIDGDGATAEQVLTGRYPFPVTCWEFA